MNTLYKSHFQDTENLHVLTQIQSFYIESSTSFEVSLEQINNPSGILHSMNITYDGEYLSISYSADYESKDMVLTFKDISRTFTFKDSTQIYF